VWEQGTKSEGNKREPKVTEQQEGVTQEGTCETPGGGGNRERESEKKKKKGCEAHMFVLSVGKSEDETRDPK